MNALALPFLALLPLLAGAGAAHAAPARSGGAQESEDAEERYRFLSRLLEKRLHQRAVKEAREFLRLYPRHAKANLARFSLAGALWELGRLEEALRDYESVARIEDFEYRAEALFRCGEGARERGDARRERAAFRAVLSAGQEYLIAPARLALGEAEFRAGRIPQAEEHYSELLEQHSATPEASQARRGLVWCAWRRGDAGQTAERARRFLESERDAATRDELALLLGEALLEDEPEAALAAFRSIAGAERRAARARGEAFALAALGRHAQAADGFEALLRSAPEGPFAAEAALQAGVEHLRSGDARQAVRELTAAARSGDAETLYWLSLAHKESGQPAAALEVLEQALGARPSDELAARIHVLRGDCLAADGRAQEAQSAYVAAGSDSALYSAGVTALNRGDHGGALRIARDIIESASDTAERHAGLVLCAEALFAAGEHGEAQSALEAALRSPADDAEAARLRSRSAWCCYLTNDLDGARRRFEDLAQRHPASGEGEEALAMLVRIAQERERPAAALAGASHYLEQHPAGRFADQASLALARNAPPEQRTRLLARFLERHPRSPLCTGARLELAELESESGRRGRARRLYRELLEQAPDSPEAPRAAYGLAWCAWEDDQHEACQQALEWLEARDGVEPELRRAALELAVWCQVERGALEEARSGWRALVAAGAAPERRTSVARRIAAKLREGEEFTAADEVLEECLRGLEHGPLAAEVALERAYVALEREDLIEVERALERARGSGAGEAALAEAGFHLGEARLAAGDPEGALASWEQAAGVEHPRAADTLYQLAFARLTRGETPAAERTLALLLERHPTSAFTTEARFLHGECAFRLGNFEQAAQRLEQAREAGPQGELAARVLFRLGLAQGELSRWPECEAALAQLARTHANFPNLAEGELWRGRALLAQKKLRPARAAFERTLALDRGELAAGARLGLGRIHEFEGNPDDALSEYLKVALLFAHEEPVSEALFSAGRVLEALGENEQAVARYRELLEQHPGSAWVTRARARLQALQERAR